MHRLLLHNGLILPTASKVVSPGQVGFLNGWGVFSTIKVMDGVLFAFERHWARMQKDAVLLRIPMPAGSEAFRRDLLSLVEANQAWNSTLRVAIARNRGGAFEGEGIDRDYDVVAFTTDTHDWGRGVRLGLLPQARHSGSPFAGTKVMSWCFNLTMLESAREAGFDEVILLDDRDRVSECTSANIFAWIGDSVLTPPLESGCLPGVTRDVLLHDLPGTGYPVLERHLTVDDLYAARSVFITSTTRELLPVLSVLERTLKQEDACRATLQSAFSQYADEYVSRARKDGLSALHHRVHQPQN